MTLLDPFLLRGLLTCELCWRALVPAFLPDAERAYSCGPQCPQPDLLAGPVESDLLLAALIRASAAAGYGWRGPAVSVEELQRWQRCDPADRRAVILTAYTEVRVNLRGQVRPEWRRTGEGAGRIRATAVADTAK